MYHTTGLDKAEILDLCEMIHQESVSEEQTWPPILGVYKSVVVTLTYLRRNRVQAEIAEAFEVSQSTISRAITALTGLVERALRRYVPTADELDDSTQYVVDGTLLPVLVLGCSPGVALRQAQDHRPERADPRHPRR
jgi:hypothetical protein